MRPALSFLVGLVLTLGLGDGHGGGLEGINHVGDFGVKVTGPTAEARLQGAQEPSQVARGQRLASRSGCIDCHGPDLAGTDFLAAMPFADLPAPNLTGQRFTDEQLLRAIRDGVGADGRALIIMPSKAYARLGGLNLQSLIAYIQSLPFVERALMPRQIGPVGRIATAHQASDLLSDRRLLAIEDPSVPSPAADGGYLTAFCTYCHGEDFGGGQVPGERQFWAPNLTSHETGLAEWDLEDFVIAVREGWSENRGGLDAVMPWKGFQTFSDGELRTMWEYLRSLPPIDRVSP